MRIPNSSETSRLLGSISLRSPFGQRDHATIRLAANTGLRVSELVGLDVGHVWHLDAPRQTIDLAPAICKYNRSRQIPLNTAAQQAVRDLVSFLKDRGFGTNAKDPLLTDRRHNRLPVREVQRSVQKYRESAGLDLRVTPHAFRHSFASNLVTEGANAYQVKELMGHLSITTSQVYVHNQRNQLVAAVNRIG